MPVLHALRVVEMQLMWRIAMDADADIDRTASAPTSGTPQSGMMREYEARRCHVCQRRYPPFGFGTPLTKPAHTIWACFAHRGQVEGLLSPPASVPTETEQLRLL
jgi:hypothetical protein